MNRKSQQGVSLVGTLVVGSALAGVVLLGLKLVPVVNEYFSIKRSIVAVAQDANPSGASVAELRNAFSKRAQVDNITSISAADLDITKDNGRIVISANYSAKVPVVANVSLLIDFEASSAAH